MTNWITASKLDLTKHLIEEYKEYMKNSVVRYKSVSRSRHSTVAGDVVKIIPHTIGTEEIFITGGGCSPWAEENTVIQCGQEAVNEAFSNDIAIIAKDSVVFTVSETSGINLFGGSSNFTLFINNILQSGGTGTALDGDEIKITPHTVGIEIIFINGSRCGVFEEETTVQSNPLPITYSKPLEAKQKQNATQLTWSVSTQINNDKYIIEHIKDGRDFSPIGEINGDGTNNEERHYTYSQHHQWV